MGLTYNGTKLTGINAPSQERWEGLTFSVGGGVTTGTPNPLYSVHNLYFNNQPVTHVKITNTYVRAYCYAGCNATFELCEGLRTINVCSFAGCPGFTSFIAPSTLETIMYYAFEGCENILEVDLSPATNLRKTSLYTFSKPLLSFRTCQSLSSSTFFITRWTSVSLYFSFIAQSSFLIRFLPSCSCHLTVPSEMRKRSAISTMESPSK